MALDAECCYAECHYAECRNAKGHGTNHEHDRLAFSFTDVKVL